MTLSAEGSSFREVERETGIVQAVSDAVRTR